MPPTYKSVPAIEKCFAILDLLSKVDSPLGISEISKQLQLNKSTVFNIIYTLVDLKALEDLGGVQPSGNRNQQAIRPAGRRPVVADAGGRNHGDGFRFAQGNAAHRIARDKANLHVGVLYKEERETYQETQDDLKHRAPHAEAFSVEEIAQKYR